ncbi:methyl-CpG-binding domain-containing protein 11-like [Cornus florida]|uniref:methyl-CpG-binding domain-containing protein 11-like n=1 Tax=Cornus florida TaxID=4283 RepID=UPI0028A0A322|nr:methyl-CpG-binding domain-containing protein 11-like [Cornus florida]
MASGAVREEMGTNNQEKRDDVVAIDLPAPDGWRKKFTPKKGGSGTPRRNEIVFISPTGEEIRNKKHLDQYLRSHPGGVSASDFDWGAGDTPRRSARINEKSKATETPEPEPPKKVQKKSSSKKGVKKEEEKIGGEGENAEDKAASVEETKGVAEVEMKDVEDAGNLNKGKVASEEAIAAEDTVKDSQQKTEIKTDETDMEKVENPEANTEETSVAKEEDAENKSLPMPGLEENKVENPEANTEGTSVAKEEDAENKPLPMPGLEEAKKEQTQPEAPSQALVPGETAKSEQEEKIIMDAAPEVPDAKLAKESETVEVEQKESAAEEVGDIVVKADGDSLKEEGQDGGKTVESHSISCGDAAHEPKASQVSC